MLICKTPFRVSFFGGGSDFPDWFMHHGGSVLSTTIDKFSYVMFRKLPEIHKYKSRIVYNIIETVKSNKNIKHPSIGPILEYYKINHGIELMYYGDLPSQTGLGSSSAFTVSLINIINAYKKQKITKKKVATDAIKIEQDILKENVGCQDQVIAAYGGFNRINFFGKNEFNIKKIQLSNSKIQKLQSNLYIFFTGISRLSGKIEKDKIKNIKSKEFEINKIMGFVGDGINILNGNEKYFSDFGNLLEESWNFKKKLSNYVSNNKLDSLYQLAKDCGAIGGKLLGAGGGGFFLFYCTEYTKNKILKKSNKLKAFPLQFEKEGSKIIFSN